MKTKSTPSTFKKFLLIFWISFSSIFLFITLLFILIAYGKLGYMPDIAELQNPKNKFATEIYTSDLHLLGRYFQSKENRVHVNYNEISPNVINALVATEDARFEEHSGIDGISLMRAIILRGILQQKSAGGGSTITQQLAKQLWSPQASNIIQRSLQKPIEWVIAVQLEKFYTKEEIITMYLNQFDFLYNAVGIKSAAHVYFNTTPDKLTIEQAATLIGMCKNPSYFNPMRRLERTQGRRNVVFSQMQKGDYINEAEYDSLSKIPLTTDFQKVDHKMGPAPYFREYLRLMLNAKEPIRENYTAWQGQKFYEDSLAWLSNPLFGFCEKNKKPDGTKYNIYSDGLKIYTTLDSRMQQYAEDAVMEHIQDLQTKFFKEKKGRSYAPFSRDLTKNQIESTMKKSMRQTDRYRELRKVGASDEEIKKSFETKIPMQVFSYKGLIDTIMSPMDSIRYLKYFLRCGFMSMNPFNGHIKAYVGGPNFSNFQYDMVSVGRRQVGSTIKPYLYTLAMEEGMAPCDEVINQPYTLMTATGEEWTPKNASDSKVNEPVTLRWGLANSNNWISAYLMSIFTPEALAKLIHSFGVKCHIDPVVSLCLGPVEITLAEMVDAYTTFPNKGLRVEPMYVTRIEDNNGNVIATFTPQMKEIISENTSYKMIHLLQGVVNGGTGIRVRYKYNITAEAGGKTGTTQNNSDGWFMGFTPSLVSGAWVGGEDRGIHFDYTTDGQGASMALPIWALYMNKVYKDTELGYSQEEKFDIPDNFTIIDGCLQDKGDPDAVDEILD